MAYYFFKNFAQKKSYSGKTGRGGGGALRPPSPNRVKVTPKWRIYKHIFYLSKRSIFSFIVHILTEQESLTGGLGISKKLSANTSHS